MCQSKANGGQRCYRTTSAQLDAAREARERAASRGEPTEQLDTAIRELQVAHASTVRGEAELRAAAATLPVGSPERAELETVIDQGLEHRAANQAIKVVMTSGNADGNVAMASYAALSTGADQRFAQTVFVDLRNEGQALGLADPSQAQVEEFLTEQQFRIRTDDTLGKSRHRLMNKLGDALQKARDKVLPDGATFHAWKNVVAESWRRANRKVAAVVLAGAAALTIGACGAAPAHQLPASQAPSVSISQVATPPPTSANTTPATSSGIPDSAFANVKPFTGPAVDKWGQANVQAAYKEMVNFTFATGWDPDTISNNKVAPSDFTDATSHMTPSMAKSFNQAVAKALHGDSDAAKTVQLLQFVNMHNASDGGTPVSGPGQTTNRTFSASNVDVSRIDGKDYLAMTIRAKAEVHTQTATGETGVLHTSRKITYYLAPNPDASQGSAPWLINGFSASSLIK